MNKKINKTVKGTQALANIHRKEEKNKISSNRK